MVKINIWFKAAWAALIAFLSGLTAAVTAGGALDLGVWLTIIVATLVAFGGVVGLGGAPTTDPNKLRIQASDLADKSNNAFTIT